MDDHVFPTDKESRGSFAEPIRQGPCRWHVSDGNGGLLSKPHPVRSDGGATLNISASVVRPADTFIAPEMRSGFMPSR